MLILTRKLHESIVIDEKTHVYVIEVIGNKVRLGVVAPQDIQVHRREVFDEIGPGSVEAEEIALFADQELHRVLNKG